MLASALLLSLLAAAPDAGTAAIDQAPLLRAPVGRVGDAVSPVPPEGYPANEELSLEPLPGCTTGQAVWVTRFLQGAIAGGDQVHAFLKTRPEWKDLFPKKDLFLEALQRARKSSGRSKVCSVNEENWRLAPGLLGSCAKDKQGYPKQYASTAKPPAYLLRISAAKAGADACRPRLSLILNDAQGKPRFAYHADYGGELELNVYGAGCISDVQFFFDKKLQAFVPTWSRTVGCKPAAK